MSDDRTPPAGGDGDEDLPTDDRGFGLTEEFARIEREIESDGATEPDPSGPDGADDEHDTGEWLPEPEGDEPQEAEEAEPVEAHEEAEEAAPVEAPQGEGEGGAEHGPGEPQADAEATEATEADAGAQATEADAGAGEAADDGAEAEDEAAAGGADASPDPAEEATVVAAAGAGAAASRPGLFSTPSTEPVIRPQPTGARPAVEPPRSEYFDDVPGPKVPSLWWRFMAGSIVIVTAVATAVALSSLLLLTDVAAKLQPIPGLQERLEAVDPGGPQTILILGSDKRSGTPGDPGRSDTTMLLRVDPDDNVLSLMSLPRDLKVSIPGVSDEAKLNDAYSYGGAPLALETVQRLTGLEINHVVNVDFQGFADAVEAIGCVYVDVDRDYFNDNSSGFDPYAAIDVNAGYQRLCGNNALQYVRYRHTDTDIVRAARQQDFLREARQQVPPKEVLPIIGGDTGSKLIDIFTKYTQSDIDSSASMIGTLRSFIGVIDVPVRQVRFQGELGPSYVTASQEQIDDVVKQFLGEDQEEADSGSNDGGSGGGEKKKDGGGGDDKEGDGISDANVIPTDDSFARFGRTSARRLKFPVFIPTAVAPDSSYDAGSRQYEIKDIEDDKQDAYKMVIEYSPSEIIPQYYGVEGTTWSDPPILNDPSETREIDGTDYDLFYDGDRLRMVSWHDSEGNSYWVQNTLERLLDEDQMLAIATSMDEAHG